MRKHFEARSRSEAQELARSWWRTQSGQTAILWVTRAISGDAPATTWEVVVHYRQTVSPLPPFGARFTGGSDHTAAGNNPPTSDGAAQRSTAKEDTRG
jgi:hypothetical protein